MLLLLQLTSAFLLLPSAGAERIIGGWEAKPHSRPYMALILTKHPDRVSGCGGILIRPDVVLSAAHCVSGEGNLKVTVILGAHNIKMNEASQQKLPVEHWVIHPKFSRRPVQNDIVLLKLKQKARLTSEVDVASLASKHSILIKGTKCTVAGWGLTSVSNATTSVLMEVDLKVQSGKKCEHTFGSDFLRKSMICAGDQSGMKSTFKGDSGGPLVCNGKVHGILSYGPTANQFLFPEIYSKVSYFKTWIKEQLQRFAFHDYPESPSSP